jgi:hypothetical protein
VANEKISELPAGSPAQPSDAIPIARGGQNFSIAVSDIGGGGPGGGINASFGGNTAGVLSLVSSGTLFLAGGNNVTLSQNGNSVTISANTAAAANLSISAGTTTGQFGGVTFGNANNVSFGLNNGTITATASQSNQTDGIYMLGNTTGQSSSNTHDARSLSIIASGLISAGWSGASLLLSAPTLPPLFSGAGISTGGNTAGITGVQSQQLVLVGGNNVTLSGSAAGGSGTVSINVPSQTNQTVGIYAQSQTFGQSSSSTYDARSLSLVGQGNIQIGQSGASIFISGASNSGASGDIFAAGNTTGQSSSSAYPLNSFNISFAGIVSGGWSSNSLIVSAPASTGISQSMFAASNTTLGTSGTQSIGSLVLAGAGNVSVGVSNGSYVISGAGGGGGGGVNFGVSTAGNTAGATGTVSTGNVVLVGSGPISLSQATGAAGSAATITINAPATSSISGTGQVSVAVAGNTISLGVPIQTIFATGNTTQGSSGTQTAGSFLVNALGNISAGYSNGSLVLSGAGGGAGLSLGVSNIGNTSGNTATYSGQVVFAGGNNITLSVSSGAAGAQTITISGANAGGAQTGISGLAVSNTTYTSGTVTFQNANGISFGSSGANGISASYTQSGQAFSAGGGSSTFSTLSFTNSNGVSFTNTNGSIAGIVATTQAIFFQGNTTGQSSSSSIADQTVSYSLGGALSGGLSGGSVLLSAPATSSISGTGLVSVVVNASTISIGAAIPQLSFFQPLGPVQSTTVTQNGLGSVQVYPAIAPFPFTASRADIMISASAAVLAVSTMAQTISAFVGLYSLNASTLTLLSSGSQSYAMTNSSNASNASITGIRRLSVPINVNYTGGFDLFIGQMSNTTFANTNGISFSNVVVPLGPGQQLQGLIGQVPANSMQFVPGQGLWSTTSAGMPSSMALSAISGAGSGGNAVDNYSPVQFANVTA